MSAHGDTLFECRDLAVGVANRVLVDGLELELGRGEFTAVLGQNGAGKTLTLHTLAGLRHPERGSVRLGRDDLSALPRAAIARRLALLPQDVDDVFPATVLDTALIGRHPHMPLFTLSAAADRDAALAALETMQLEALAGRDVLTLSGGERRRLAVAQTLAQEPEVYLLDEPTNHLDPQHQLDVLYQFRRVADAGAAVVASLHDINLAARVADRCLLLFGDGRWSLGPVDEVLDEARLERLYGTGFEAVSWRDRRLFVATRRPPDGSGHEVPKHVEIDSM